MYSLEGSTAHDEVWRDETYSIAPSGMEIYPVTSLRRESRRLMSPGWIVLVVCSELRNATKSCISAQKHYFQHNLHSVITIQQYFRAYLRELECEIVPMSQWRWTDGIPVPPPSRFCQRKKQERLTGCTGPPSRWVQRLNEYWVYSLPGGPNGPDLWYNVQDYVKFH